MTSRHGSVRRVTSAAFVLPVLLAMPSEGPASPDAAPDDLRVTNHETVLARLDSGGTVVSAQLIDLLTGTGTGTRTVQNPSAIAGLRSLESYGRPDVSGQSLVQTVEPGSHVATRAIVEKSLPVALHAQYELDGVTVSPAQVRGRSGRLVITYTVTNQSAVDTTITYADAAGKKHTVTEKVFTPLVGNLVADLPFGYRDVAVAGGTITGTGSGRSHVAFNLVLAPPMGNPQTEVTVAANVSDAAIPAARLQLVPATTKTDPATSFAQKTFARNGDGNLKLAEGAGIVDDQVVSLQKGVAGMADGLSRLASGANSLQRQMSGQLAPAAQTAATGASRTSDGAQRLAEGNGQLAASATTAAGGAQQLSDGLTQLDQGLNQMSGAGGLPAAVTATRMLAATVRQIVAELGSPDDPETLLGAMTRLTNGSQTIEQRITEAQTSTSSIGTAVEESARRTDPLADAASSTAALVEQVREAHCGPGGALPAPDCTLLRQVQQQGAETAEGITAVGDALTRAATSLESLAHGLGQIEQAVADLTHGLAATTTGLQQIRRALSSSGTNDATQTGVLEGLDALVVGLTQQTGAAVALSTASSGSTAAADQLSAGISQLADGATGAANGAGELARGANELAAGNRKLAEGARSGATGAGALATGLDSSHRGATEVADGAEDLHNRGSSPLTDSIVSGSATTAEVSALFSELDARAADALSYGAPDGATGVAMWMYSLDPTAASDPDGGPGEQFTALILVALALFLGCAAVSGAVRRWPG